jgi:hypothetical protein
MSFADPTDSPPEKAFFVRYSCSNSMYTAKIAAPPVRRI